MPGLTDYAQLAGLTLLAGRAERDRAQMAMLDDRDRIARDMHEPRHPASLCDRRRGHLRTVAR